MLLSVAEADRAPALGQRYALSRVTVYCTGHSFFLFSFASSD
jgi:hypothetical protein